MLKKHFLGLLTGAVIALEFNGDGVVEECRLIVDKIFSGSQVQDFIEYISSYVLFNLCIYCQIVLVSPGVAWDFFKAHLDF